MTIIIRPQCLHPLKVIEFMRIRLMFLFQREIQTLREKLRKTKTSTDVATAEQVCKQMLLSISFKMKSLILFKIIVVF